MRKILILIIFISLISIGCSKVNNGDSNIKNDNKVNVSENTNDKYIDDNNTPIGIYKLEGRTLTKIHKFQDTFIPDKDIIAFQIFPSNEEKIVLDQSFGKSFYNEFLKYNLNNNLKIGFNIKFTLNNGENINYNILTPDNTFDKWEYLLNYLYDDYINDGKGFYSHLEMADYNENTLFTTFKMQSSGYVNQINSKIEFSVFTYNGEDDFLDNNYRGNSIYTINICNSNIICE